MASRKKTAKKGLRYGRASKPLEPSQASPEAREGRLVVYMTNEDLEELNRVSGTLGLSRSALVSSILERLIIGGFSPIAGMKLCYQLQKRFEARGGISQGLYFGVRPLPPLPDEELSAGESKQLLETVKQELKPC